MPIAKSTVLLAAFFTLLFACSSCSRSGYGPPREYSETDTESDGGLDADTDASADDGSDDGTDADADADTGIDECPDDDTDGVCNSLDMCAGDDATGDTDGDGDCNDRDTDDDGDSFSDAVETACGSNPLLAASVPPDTDSDGVCDALDMCTGNNATGDTDSDGVCNDQDPDDDGDSFSDAVETACGSNPLLAASVPPDTDSDGVCDALDMCTGNNATGDTDGDRICSDRDTDDDGDGFSDAVEAACGSNPQLSGSTPVDSDADGVCDGLDMCTGNDASGNSDSDLTCNDQDTDDDGDGWSDVDEIDCGTDPLLASSVPTDVNHDGICDANQLVELKLVASDAQASDYSGYSVAISGTVAIVGAYYEDGGVGDPKTNAGAAYIFQLESGQWIQKQKLTASDADASDYFGISVAISGDVAIVGAYLEDGGVGDPRISAGAAYIFQLESGQWVEIKKLTASDAQASDWFGRSVAISGDVAIVGAFFENGGVGDPRISAGAAYIFQLESGQWAEIKKLTASDAQASDRFGNSVAISGNVAIVGTYLEDGGAGDPKTNAGAAYIFQLESGHWVEKKKLTASDADASDFFGISVAISGDVAIVGAYEEDAGVGDPRISAGAAYIFQLESGQWVEKQKLTASDAQDYDYFGTSVAISGSVAIVGAYEEDAGVGETSAGAAYIFQLESGQWVEKQKLTASDPQADDNFGTSVAISGSVAIVGAPQEDGGVGDPKTNAGAVYLYLF